MKLKAFALTASLALAAYLFAGPAIASEYEEATAPTASVEEVITASSDAVLPPLAEVTVVAEPAPEAVAAPEEAFISLTVPNTYSPAYVAPQPTQTAPVEPAPVAVAPAPVEASVPAAPVVPNTDVALTCPTRPDPATQRWCINLGIAP